MAPVVPEQSPPTHVVVRVAGVAVIGDGFGSAGGVFMSDDVCVLQPHGNRTTGAEGVAPRETKVWLVRRLEMTTRCHRHVTWLHDASSARVPVLDVVARAAVTIDATAIVLAARACLHQAAADLAVADIADT